MRYYINFNKVINQIVPHYIGGRKLILFLQALIYPLQIINNEFKKYAKETRIEASMTSQIMYFEWFLNRKMSRYFKNRGEIVITNGSRVGVPMYHEGADVLIESNVVLRNENEGATNSTPFYYSNEGIIQNSFSFLVSSPAIDTKLITSEQYEAMLSYYIDKYRIANKTFKIIINA